MSRKVVQIRVVEKLPDGRRIYTERIILPELIEQHKFPEIEVYRQYHDTLANHNAAVTCHTTTTLPQIATSTLKPAAP